ncbi:F-box/kelch-repeat protein At1g55270-like [Cryptomeria japonica]|uniref:F-box/kelch-repeat protein At1g55270-like n=1 Tax=Cryptomeria japonica TaxID=3369 RepID=UPI0027D9D593|nr:F-box/kelch-repeat protein At1g55270-like [Cryptomeria japonica]
MVEDPQFYEDRLRSGRSEEFICLLETVNRQFKSLPLVTIYDPINKLWEKLPPIPAEFEFCSSSKLICVKHKLRKGADMPTRECPANFGCCASPEGLIYLAGGRQNGEITGKATSQAAVYNVETNEWKLLPNMLQKQWLCECVFIEGIKYVVCLYDEEVQQFEPETEVWSILPNMWFIEDCLYPMVAAFGRLYCFQWDVVTE